MELTLNGSPFVFEGTETTLAALMEKLGMTADVRGVAAALNGRVVPRTGWSATELKDGDRLEVVTAFQGG